MGCSNTKEKIESELIKMKMARSEVQMERYNQLQLLKEIDGTEIKTKAIPDYIDQDFVKEKLLNGNSVSFLTQGCAPKKKTIRPRRAKSFKIKRKTDRINEEDEIKTESKQTKRFRRKTAKE